MLSSSGKKGDEDRKHTIFAPGRACLSLVHVWGYLNQGAQQVGSPPSPHFYLKTEAESSFWNVVIL
jgi:hypothetical protein